ncbi:MAG: class I SAM-dependent methyltransferase [Dissulfurispiraceae bacterium]
MPAATQMTKKTVAGEYERRGDYHKQLSPDWSYYPLYLSKKKFVIDYLSKGSRDRSILDIGCGEGVFVRELLDIGFLHVRGVDTNYSSDIVSTGDVLSLPFDNGQFDVVLLLDVIEHVSVELQPQALMEVFRVIKDEGTLIASIPNLSHLASRIRFLLKGNFVRTSSVNKHPGDRPIKESLSLLKEAGFHVQERKGFFPTIPILYKLVQKYPARFMWLYTLSNLLLPFRNLCFLNIIVCRKKG